MASQYQRGLRSGSAISRHSWYWNDRHGCNRVVSTTSLPSGRLLRVAHQTPQYVVIEWYVDAMRVTMDRAGRIVIPKKLRDSLGLQPDAELELHLDGTGFRAEV